MRVSILHTNDFHGTLDDARQERIASFRAAADLYFDSGDCIKAGNLGVPMRQEPVWGRLAQLDCSASVLGNRETHPLESAFKAKLSGVTHTILCANLRRKDGERPLPASKVYEVDGGRVGVFAVMVPMVTERMATKAASAYLWDDPIKTAKEQVAALRGHVDALIALTHIGFKRDVELAEACPQIDLIFGGHSHTVVPDPVSVGNTRICQGGSHGKYVGRYVWERGKGLVFAHLEPLLPESGPKR